MPAVCTLFAQCYLRMVRVRNTYRRHIRKECTNTWDTKRPFRADADI